MISDDVYSGSNRPGGGPDGCAVKFLLPTLLLVSLVGCAQPPMADRSVQRLQAPLPLPDLKSQIAEANEKALSPQDWQARTQWFVFPPCRSMDLEVSSDLRTWTTVRTNVRSAVWVTNRELAEMYRMKVNL